MSEKTQEQRIEDAARALAKDAGADWGVDSWYLGKARVALEAADAPPKPKPKWPFDESVAALGGVIDGYYSGEPVRDALRDAMLADPIIRRAIKLRDARRRAVGVEDAQRDLILAVDEAGL